MIKVLNSGSNNDCGRVAILDIEENHIQMHLQLM
jgi:hypothetical protein